MEVYTNQLMEAKVGLSFLEDYQKVILEKLIWRHHPPIQIDFTHLSKQEKVREAFMFLMIKDQVSM